MDNIKTLRRSTGLTQAAFSARYHIPRRTVENWESGVSQPPPYVVELLAYRIEKEKEEQS